jgi:hypothetical protein
VECCLRIGRSRLKLEISCKERLSVRLKAPLLTERDWWNGWSVPDVCQDMIWLCSESWSIISAVKDRVRRITIERGNFPRKKRHRHTQDIITAPLSGGLNYTHRRCGKFASGHNSCRGTLICGVSHKSSLQFSCHASSTCPAIAHDLSKPNCYAISRGTWALDSLSH